MTDQHITTLATIVQDFILLVSAGLIAWYLCETRRLRKVAEQQVRVSQDLHRSSQEQAESQVRPAIAVMQRGAPHGIDLHNLGKGPAFCVRLSSTSKDSAGRRGLLRLPNVAEDVAYIDENGTRETNVFIQNSAPSGCALLAGSSLQCEYKSLSGRTYWTVVDFDLPTATVVDTRFYTERDGVVVLS